MYSRKRSKKYARKTLFDPQELSKYRTVTQKTGQVIRPKSSPIRGTRLPKNKKEVDDFLDMLNKTRQYRIIPLPGLSSNSVTFNCHASLNNLSLVNKVLAGDPLPYPFSNQDIWPMTNVPIDLFPEFRDILSHFQPYTNIPVKLETMTYNFTFTPTVEALAFNEPQFGFVVYSYIESKENKYPTVPYIDPSVEDDNSRNWLNKQSINSRIYPQTQIDINLIISPYEVVHLTEPIPHFTIEISGPPSEFIENDEHYTSTNDNLFIDDSDLNLPAPIQHLLSNYVIDTPIERFADIMSTSDLMKLPLTSIYENPFKDKLSLTSFCTVEGLNDGVPAFDYSVDVELVLTLDLSKLSSSLS